MHSKIVLHIQITVQLANKINMVNCCKMRLLTGDIHKSRSAVFLIIRLPPTNITYRRNDEIIHVTKNLNKFIHSIKSTYCQSF